MALFNRQHIRTNWLSALPTKKEVTPQFVSR